jgi:SAM-dependent methyltransferase
MMRCRVCQKPLGGALLSIDAPALTSVNGLVDTGTQVFGCRECGHYQSNDFGNTDEYYANSYRISLGGPEHDQLYEYADGMPRFRTDVQAEIVLSLGLGTDIQVLDFGAAKADTLRKVVRAEPSWNPHVFDVSNDYRESWHQWVPESQQAVNVIPSSWEDRFDLVTAHFVLEHVPDPVQIVQALAGVLKPDGVLMLSVPDASSNTGDLLVADHLSHFTRRSIWTLLSDAGFRSWSVLEGAFRGAFVIIAYLDSSGVSPLPRNDSVQLLDDELSYWGRVIQGIVQVDSDSRGEPKVIYGAGFYGTLIGSRMSSPPVAYLDRNAFLHGTSLLGATVVTPDDCPMDASLLFVGLNPQLATHVVSLSESWLPKGCKVVTFDDLSRLSGNDGQA